MGKNVTPIEDHDFGFDFQDDMTEHLTSKADAAESKAQALYNAIMPLLNNLKKNPDKTTIVWPDRQKKIDDFIKKLDNILNG